MIDARALIEAHGLQPHPEGGWYRETFRSPAPPGHGRATATMIHFLLEAGQASHWHRVDADELWLWHAGDPLALRVAADEDAVVETLVLGDAGEAVTLWQGVVPQGQWQAAMPLPGPHGYAFVSCVVAPGFEFDGFELAPSGWTPRKA